MYGELFINNLNRYMAIYEDKITIFSLLIRKHHYLNYVFEIE